MVEGGGVLDRPEPKRRRADAGARWPGKNDKALDGDRHRSSAEVRPALARSSAPAARRGSQTCAEFPESGPDTNRPDCTHRPPQRPAGPTEAGARTHRPHPKNHPLALRGQAGNRTPSTIRTPIERLSPKHIHKTANPLPARTVGLARTRVPVDLRHLAFPNPAYHIAWISLLRAASS